MKLIFLGSPQFAVYSLEALLESKHEILGVITQPDRPSGRGLKLNPPAVKICAVKNNLPVYQTESINSEESLDWIRKKKPDILVVVAFGEFLKKAILNSASYPPINVHPSLLPDLRGAAPIQWALLRGYERSGISTQFMVSKMDAGDILLQEEAFIQEDDTSASLHERFGKIGGSLLVRTLTLLEEKKITPKPQDDRLATFAPLLEKSQGEILWAKPAKEIHNQVRGLFPWPSAWTIFHSQHIKIIRSTIPRNISGSLDLAHKNKPVGTFFLQNDRFFVTCGKDILEILEIQPEGQRSLLPLEFYNGIKGKLISETIFQFGK